MVQKRGIERQLAALRAQGHPTSLAELAELHPLPEGVRNGADVYMQALAAFLRPVDEANTLCVGQAELPVAGAPMSEAVSLATEQFLADNQACLDLLRDAGAIEHCRYDWDYARGMPYLASVRRCAQLLACAIVVRGYQDDATEVLAHLEDELHLARSLRHEPSLICYLVRVACTALTLNALERTLSVTSFTDEQLVRMDRMLAEAAATMDLTEALISERCFTIEYIRDPSLLGPIYGNGVLSVPGLRRIGMADILDYMTRCVEASDLSPVERVARFRQIREELQDLSVLHVVAKMLAPGLGRVAELDLRVAAHLDLARCALAIERYRLATGKVPNDLDTLVPDYLGQVPLDPFDGRPVRYRPAATGYRLYSIMEDGKDNGGLARDEVNKGDPYDLCFTVAH
jgi:hypothetical protein